MWTLCMFALQAFHLVMSLFSHIAYGGNMGLIISPIGFLTALLHFVAIFVCKDYKCPLELEVKCKCDIKKEDDGRNMYAKVTSWFCLIASCLVVVVGFFRIFVSGAELHWNHKDFINDGPPKYGWRQKLFTFVPDILADAWTPAFMGTIGVFFHFKSAPLKLAMFCSDWWRFFGYHFVMALFGCMGYAASLGILCASFVLLATLLALVAAIICKCSPCLDLEISCNCKVKGEGT
eukprot:GHVU01103361.1.p1 GENE.GHVU01103361.1~~GHVU01103361.1.p1  ORF type:complete len:234 (-),score=21.97 GHVU01103361.1:59-760(-)